MKGKNKLFYLLFCLFICFVFFSKAVAVSVSNESISTYEVWMLFANAMDLIRTECINKVDDNKLLLEAIKSMAHSADSWAEVISVDEKSFSKEGVGVGLRLYFDEGKVKVIDVIENSPASDSGIKRGDIIISIDGKSVVGLDLSSVMRRLKGRDGSKVKIEVFREGVGFLGFDLERKKIVSSDIESKVLQDRIGYVRITMFSKGVGKKLKKILSEFMDKGINNLILDLRTNPGGLFEESNFVLNLFVPKGKFLFSLEDREKNRKKTFSLGDDILWQGKIVVLVDEITASCGELVAGVLQSVKGAKVIGRITSGKGTIQKRFYVGEGIFLRLSVGYVILPDGTYINKRGILPDITIEDSCINDRNCWIDKAVSVLKK